jgi:hypothetical protein
VLDAEERPVVDEAGNPVNGPDGEPVTEQVQFCSDFIDDGKSQFVTFRITRPGVYPYRAEGHVEAEGRFVVS